MVIMTAKVPKRRLLLIVLLLIAAAVVLALCLRGAGGETEKPAKTGTQGATKSDTSSQGRLRLQANQANMPSTPSSPPQAMPLNRATPSSFLSRRFIAEGST